METAAFETDLSLFKYDNLEQLPPAYRDLEADERTERIESALDTLGDDVVILGHNYQRREIVEHADFIGDSYQLSKEAAESDADYVIFGGVTFMAESADIITDDDQSVILPSMEASCPMAGMAEALQVDAAWAELTAALDDDEEIIPITYMNSYADLKAFCAEQGGWCVRPPTPTRPSSTPSRRATKYSSCPTSTSREHGPPARHGRRNRRVGPWDAEGTDAADAVENDVILWEGYCQVHERFREHHIESIREDYPDANVIVHPECRREVVEAADVAGSTSTICESVAEADPGETWAIGTEIHLTHHLQRWHPEVNVVPLCGDAAWTATRCARSTRTTSRGCLRNWSKVASATSSRSRPRRRNWHRSRWTECWRSNHDGRPDYDGRAGRRLRHRRAGGGARRGP